MTEREEKAKAWLNRNYGMSLEIAAFERRLERMASDLEKVCKPLRLKEVQEEPAGNSQEERMAEYLDLSSEVEKKKLMLDRADKETMRVIEQVEGSVLRTILIERYVNRLRWKEMVNRIHFEQSRLFDYHRQALDAVLPFIPEEAKRSEER